MDRHGVLLWGKLWRPDEARIDWGGLYFDYYSRIAPWIGLSAWR
jgi:hypothetical protein